MKSQINVCIDTDVLAELRLRRIPMSGTINSYLRAFLSLSEKTQTNKTELTKESLRLSAELEKVKLQQALILAEEDKAEKKFQDNVSKEIVF